MKNILKKSIAILMSTCMFMSVATSSFICVSSAEVNSTNATAGEVIISGNFKYSILEDGTAQIEGTAVKKLEKIEVPSKIDGYTVTKIARSSFENEVASEIILPDTLKEIGYNAFYNCDNIKNFELPEGVTEIKEGTFSACSNLVSLVLPNSITCINNFAIQTSNKLKEITFKSSRLIIDAYAIKSLGLTNVNFTDNLKSIGFSETCIESEVLTTLNIPDSAKKVNFAMCSFDGCPNLAEINIPDSSESEVHINATALYNTKWYANQPQGIVMLGNYVIGYKGTISEKTVLTIPKGTYGIASDAFSFNNDNIVEVMFPDSLKYIDDNAFADCEQLKEIAIPDNVTYIGESAFSDCKRIKNVVIPSGVTNIGNYAFKGCYSIKNLTISNGITSIGDHAFDGCYSIKTLSIPNSVTNIGYYAFNSCSSIENLSISNSVTSIGDYAFNNCSSIKNVAIPASVTQIGIESFGYSKDASMDDFCIYGYKDTTAEAYADENEFEFKLINDIDSDNQIDVKDVTMLQMHLAGYKVSADSFNIDVNLDGKVDVADVTKLQLILAGI